MRGVSNRSMTSTKIEINPTIVPDSFSDIERESARYAHFASYFQIDVADGKFAPNTTWLPEGGEKLPEDHSYEVHMMVADPIPIGTAFARMGAKRIIAHVEALPDSRSASESFQEWKDAGVDSVGLAVLLQTPFVNVEPYLENIDFVLLMTIARIGVQGIPFEESSIDRVAEFARMHPHVQIAVDGGVSEKTIQKLVRAGATRFGVGSAIARSDDPARAFVRLHELAATALNQ